MVVCIYPEVVLRLLREPPPGNHIEVLEHRLKGPDEEYADSKKKYLAIERCESEAGYEAVVALNDKVNGCAYKDLWHDIKYLVENRED